MRPDSYYSLMGSHPVTGELKMVHVCTSCGVVYSNGEEARKCCECRDCGALRDKSGKSGDRKRTWTTRTQCGDCREAHYEEYAAKQHAKRLAQIAAFPKVKAEDYSVDMIFHEPSDEFRLTDDGYDGLEGPWLACELRPMPVPDAEDIIQNMLEQADVQEPEGWDLDSGGLQRVIDKWYSEQHTDVFYPIDVEYIPFPEEEEE